ncbi:MAG: tyrosine-type recombinase/integrase [Deltaproteobacteria bacterium]|nr:tyrosine-type recombinase/integrase [Deltaproteobacteria bacterium]
MHIEVAIEKYLNILKRQALSSRTIHARKIRLEFLTIYLTKIEKKDIRSVTPKDILQFKQFIYQKPWQQHTVYGVLEAVQNFFNRLHREDLLFINPVEKVLKASKPIPKLHKILTITEMKQLLNSPFERFVKTGLRDKAMIELLYSTGIRLSELRNLKKSNIDFKDNVIFIERGKGRKDRVVPLGRHARRALESYQTSLRPRLIHKKTEILFLNKNGKKMDINMPAIVLKKYAKLNGLKKRIYPHLLRHTMASHFLEAGATISIVQHVLGHASPETTQIYTQMRPHELRICYLRFHPLEKNKLFQKLYKSGLFFRSGGKA